MIFCKYKFHVPKRKIADFFEPSEILFGQIQVFSFSEHRNLVNIRRRIIRWLVYNQISTDTFCLSGTALVPFAHSNVC